MTAAGPAVVLPWHAAAWRRLAGLRAGSRMPHAILLAGPAGDKIVPYTTEIGITLLWISAVVTLYTGWDYFRSGLKHMI